MNVNIFNMNIVIRASPLFVFTFPYSNQSCQRQYQLSITVLSVSMVSMLKSYHNEPVLSIDSDRLSRVLLSIDLRSFH